MDAQTGPYRKVMRLTAFDSTNFAARHRSSSPRPAARYRQHPYTIPEKDPSAERLLTLQRREYLQGTQIILPNETLGGNRAYLKSMASAAGPTGVIQGGGASQQTWPQSASSAPSFGTNPGISAPSATDRRSANHVAPDEQLGIPSTTQEAFLKRVPTAGLSVAAPQGLPSMIPDEMRPPQLTERKPTIQSEPILPPTQEQLAYANDVIKNLKQIYSAKPPTMQLHALSDDHRMEYNKLLEQVHKMTQDLDAKLPMYWIVLRSVDMIRNLVAIVSLVAYQRFRGSIVGSYLVIIDRSALQSMYGLLQKAIEHFEQRHQMLEAAVTPQQMGGGLTGPIINRPSPLLTAPSVITSTQSIPPIPIPDLTGLITRCNKDPVSGGTFGNIYKCIYHGTEGDIDVAVKAFRPQFFNTGMMFAFERELGIWKRLRHHNILKFMGTTRDFGPPVALVAPWVDNDTLTSFLNNNSKTLTRRDRLLLLRDIAAGLHYLHTFSFAVDGHTYSNPVVHGDLTGNNVLIGSDRTAYLADFGLSGTLTKLPGMTYLAKMSRHPGAVRWAAPELLSVEESGSAITTQSDIYSFGSVMLQVLTGVVPWHQLTNDFIIWLKVIVGERNPRPDHHCVTDRQWDFITRCCSKTPIERPSAEEALRFVESELACTTMAMMQFITSY
ncbi:kinase-like domain-containing protein [Suillus paluster]|uniref:kinase-like domain-containing protein n=1 Tax=Suillus paluster TaxID=48578 RepID=UPI001B87EE74|nr:kinase-like domain-containing protein [Suillus paluster]KAG1723356.1 kinase-like domain-containing protein [Suillus paluster]